MTIIDICKLLADRNLFLRVEPTRGDDPAVRLKLKKRNAAPQELCEVVGVPLRALTDDMVGDVETMLEQAIKRFPVVK